MKVGRKFTLWFVMVSIIIITINLSGFNVMAAAPTALPLISRSVPAYASGDYPASANDNNYSSAWRATMPG